MASKKERKKATSEHLPKPRQRIRLKSARDVCRYISSCIRRAEQGGGDNTFYKRVMMASMLIKALEVTELEERIEKLETTARERYEH
ncbi:MAG: hypothetical protein V1799_09695 [bacterium]